MLKIGLTGNIASGKSEVEKFFIQNGIPVIDADAVNSKLLAENEQVIEEIKNAFAGKDIFESEEWRVESGDNSPPVEGWSEGGLQEKHNSTLHSPLFTLSKKKLADLIFSDRDAKQKLENILHPQIKQGINEFFGNHKDSEIVVVSAALLYEAGWQNMFDKIILVTAPENIRHRRLMTRNNLTAEAAQRMLDAQLNDNDKPASANYVIHNDKDLAKLFSQSSAVLADLDTVNKG